ncbi:MAG TPA: hypothetical protein VHJ38_00470 [Nitrososphaeraceae archaeon]|nr:hypothetical protein [Nitrososphaeraceae archaeon]
MIPIIPKKARSTLHLITKIGGMQQRKRAVEKCSYHLLPRSILNTINSAMAITSSAAESRL